MFILFSLWLCAKKFFWHSSISMHFFVGFTILVWLPIFACAFTQIYFAYFCPSIRLCTPSWASFCCCSTHRYSVLWNFLVLCSVILFHLMVFVSIHPGSRFIVNVYVYSLFIMLFVCTGLLIFFYVVLNLLLTDYYVCPSILNYVLSVYWFTDCCVCRSICLSCCLCVLVSSFLYVSCLSHHYIWWHSVWSSIS